MKLFLLLLLLASCQEKKVDTSKTSSPDKDVKSVSDILPANEVEQFNRTWKFQNEACWKQQMNIESIQSTDSEGNLAFVQDDKKALESFEKIDLELFDLSRRLEYKRVVLETCKPTIKPKMKDFACPTHDGINMYFRLILKGVEKGYWTESTRAKGVQLTVAFVKRQLHARGEIDTVPTMINILSRLDELKILKGNHSKELSKIREGWKKDAPKFTGQDFECNTGIKNMIATEHEVTKYLAKLQKFETDLP